MTEQEELLEMRKARMKSFLAMHAPDMFVYEQAKLIIQAYENTEATND